ncbi:hypothetical protein NLI96_g8998 [Meripilus lineatus]|uniref:26S proteasome regulatory subunit 4 homolog n=1 Tax=Meripilus lineatus TaxID=2056292 RepID=A0AAD5V1J8_9APHY|nr:hypothetical protein NLI96_g8998 [Physisporinus lineatus]
MGNAPSGMGPGGGGHGHEKKDQQPQKKKWEPPLPTRVGKKKKRGPAAASKLPAVVPATRCRLKLLKMERIKDFLLMEEEFIQNQERLKPETTREDKNEEDRTKVDDLRGTPMAVGTLEEIIDDDHAIISTASGPEFYVSIMSFVDKDLLEPSCQVLLHHKTQAIIGVLQDDTDPMVSVMKLDKAPTESYADIGGLETQIQEIKESVELPLTHPELYEEMGIKPPKGVILYGVPGTGKTLLAKAVANQTSATFLRIVGSELIQKYLGDGPKLVRNVFRVAEEHAPSIVFIDEIDAIGTKRYDSTSGGEREIQRTMLELLNQLDGFDTRGDVKVIMATNKIETLDPALIRPGRIDRKIEFPLPDIKTKRHIFRLHTSRMNLSEDVELEEFVTAKDDLSGADIKAVCTEAGLLALRERRMRVTKADFTTAREKVLYRKNEVREHFSSPLLQYAADDGEKTFTLVECPSGTGQLISRLTNDEIDIAIALTDPLISGIAKGSEAYKLVGSYVTTPLNWAVTTGVSSRFKSISDLKDTTLGISRYGSGSQTMAYVMALQQGWPTDGLKFQVNNDIHRLVASVNDDSTSAFMWEWFTTKPWVDSGEVRFIGSVPTPWPSWLIAAHPTRAPADALRVFLQKLTTYVRNFDSEEKRAHENVEFIKEKFGYPEEDIKAWLKTVGYPQDCATIPRKVITDTLDVLIEAGFVTKPEGGFSVEQFVNSDVVNLA